MNGRHALRWALLAGFAAGIAALFWFARPAPGIAPKPARVLSPAVPAAPSSPPPTMADNADPASGGESHLADDLNAPTGTIRRDLEILNELFGTWQTNFPREGNPVGENAEITASLAGANSLKFAFISPKHRAINRQGELCDRWGTPFRFHQISGQAMEIRSAGPDRKFGTADDARWVPPQ